MLSLNPINLLLKPFQITLNYCYHTTKPRGTGPQILLQLPKDLFWIVNSYNNIKALRRFSRTCKHAKKIMDAYFIAFPSEKLSAPGYRKLKIALEMGIISSKDFEHYWNKKRSLLSITLAVKRMLAPPDKYDRSDREKFYKRQFQTPQVSRRLREFFSVIRDGGFVIPSGTGKECEGVVKRNGRKVVITY